MCRSEAYDKLVQAIDEQLPEESEAMTLARIRGTLALIRNRLDDARENGNFNSMEEARAFCEQKGWDTYHLINTEHGWNAEEYRG